MKQYKSRDKITQKMTRDGLIEVNETQQTAERISKREQDADFQKSPEQQTTQDGTQLQGLPSQTSPLPHAPGAAPARDTATADRVMEHIEAAQTRKSSKKAVRKAQEEATAQTTSSRLQFTEEELAAPELERYIEKSNKAADRLDAAKAAIPKQKKLVKERTFDEAAGKAKTRLRFEEQEKPIPGGKAHRNPLSRPAQEAGIFVHNKIHSVEKDNSGVEGAHKSEELAERGARYGTRKLKQGYRSHKLKPYREAAKAEQAAFKANVNFQYHKALQENPQLTSNPLSRFMQKQKIKRQYAKTVKKGGAATAKAAAGASQTAAKKAAAFAGRHPAGVIIAIAALLLFIMVSVGLSSCGAMFSGSMNSVLGTSYTSEDSDLVATEQSYAAMENELQQEIDNIESTHPGYDEYRYDLDTIGHNPHELASYLTALLQSYTPQSAQAELKRLFGLQYTLTLTEEIEIRTTTDEEGNEEEYEYRILNVKLTNKPIASLAEELLNPQQFEMFKVYLQTQGNKPLIFGGGSPDGSPSEDLSGVEFVNGTRPGNPELMELAKQQVGNVGGYPYWSWYGFNSRVEWCACFVSWCYNQAGKSEPRFAGCEWQGVPWFQSRGQWGARGYENIAPGDAIFFDWDLDGVADHVGLVLGRDGSRVYTVEGNSGDACKIKSYDLNYQCIKGYGLMNW
ncbi:MAG: CHAP domain-containing protein [Gallintestinimicrobium sp.]